MPELKIVNSIYFYFIFLDLELEFSMISYMTVIKCHTSIIYHMILLHVIVTQSHVIENIEEDSRTIILYYMFFRIG